MRPDPCPLSAGVFHLVIPGNSGYSALMTPIRSNIRKLYLFAFLQMSLFPMAIITLFWKDQIGLSLTQILLLQGIFSVAMVVMEYPSGYLSDRIGSARNYRLGPVYPGPFLQPGAAGRNHPRILDLLYQRLGQCALIRKP
jgi:MFS family permease